MRRAAEEGRCEGPCSKCCSIPKMKLMGSETSCLRYGSGRVGGQQNLEVTRLGYRIWVKQHREFCTSDSCNAAGITHFCEYQDVFLTPLWAAALLNASPCVLLLRHAVETRVVNSTNLEAASIPWSGTA